MKSILACISLSISLNAFAADTFTCTVFKKVVTSNNCTVCVVRNGDNDCLKEEETTCYTQNEVYTGVEEVALHPSSTQLHLGRTNGDISFIFDMSQSGFSSRITSKKESAEATFQSSLKLDPWHDSFELLAKTNKSSNIVGNVTEIILKCGAL
jgi:hypothetical protein